MSTHLGTTHLPPKLMRALFILLSILEASVAEVCNHYHMSFCALKADSKLADNLTNCILALYYWVNFHDFFLLSADFQGQYQHVNSLDTN